MLEAALTLLALSNLASALVLWIRLRPDNEKVEDTLRGFRLELADMVDKAEHALRRWTKRERDEAAPASRPSPPAAMDKAAFKIAMLQRARGQR